MLLGVSSVFVLLIYQFQAIQFWMGVIFVLTLLIFVFIIIRSSRKKRSRLLKMMSFLNK